MSAGILVSSCASPAATGSGTTNQTPAQLINSGLAALNAKNNQTARTDFDEVLKIDPDNKQGDNKIAYFDLGVIDQSQGNTTGSEDEYNNALNIDPNYVLALYNLGVEMAGSNPTDAISLYRRAVASEPNYVEAVYNLGLLLYQQGQVAEGQSYLSKAIAMDPSYQKLLPAGVTP
jgi:Tfp pilus assembly protein PilF